MTCANFRDRAEATRSLVYNKNEIKKKLIEWWQMLLFPRGGFVHSPCTYCSERWPCGETKNYQHQWHCDFEKGLLVDRWQVCWPHPRGLLRGKIIVYLTVHWGKREPQTSHSNRNPTSWTDSRWKDNTRSGIWHFFIPLSRLQSSKRLSGTTVACKHTTVRIRQVKIVEIPVHCVV